MFTRPADAKRGWPFFETSVSQFIKPAHLCLDLGSDAAKESLARFQGQAKEVEVLAKQHTYTHAFNAGLLESFKGQRLPPLVPSTFASRAEDKTLTNGKDKSVLLNLQARVAKAVLGAAEDMSFLKLGWGASEAQLLAETLPMCSRLCTLRYLCNKSLRAPLLASISSPTLALLGSHLSH